MRRKFFDEIKLYRKQYMSYFGEELKKEEKEEQNEVTQNIFSKAYNIYYLNLNKYQHI
jgi:hypothetical protein